MIPPPIQQIIDKLNKELIARRAQLIKEGCGVYTLDSLDMRQREIDHLAAKAASNADDVELRFPDEIYLTMSSHIRAERKIDDAEEVGDGSAGKAGK